MIKSMNVYKNKLGEMFLAIGLINKLVYCLTDKGEFNMCDKEDITELELIGNMHKTPELVKHFTKTTNKQ